MLYPVIKIPNLVQSSAFYEGKCEHIGLLFNFEGRYLSGAYKSLFVLIRPCKIRSLVGCLLILGSWVAHDVTFIIDNIVDKASFSLLWFSFTLRFVLVDYHYHNYLTLVLLLSQILFFNSFTQHDWAPQREIKKGRSIWCYKNKK